MFMTTNTKKNKIDIFVSYNSKDKDWAEWVAWVLEQNKFKTVIQCWDFAEGSNFVLEMQRASENADKTIAILTENYLSAEFTQPEWAASFVQDPTGKNRRFIPVRVQQCNIKGLFKPIVYIDLVGVDKDNAMKVLIEGIKGNRKKPITPPSFPGSKSL